MTSTHERYTMEMATTTTTTATTTKSGEHDEESSSIIHDSGSSGDGERRRQVHCTKESPLHILQSSSEDAHDHNAMDTTYTTTTSSSHNAAPPLRNHTSSVENMTIVNLREEDADILEQGVEEKRMHDLVDFDEDGRRLDTTSVLLSHLSSSSLTDLAEGGGCLSIEDYSFDRHHHVQQHHHQDISSNSTSDDDTNDITTEISSGASSSPTTIQRSIIHDNNDSSSIMPVIAEDSSILIPHYHHHHLSRSPQDDDDADDANNANDKAYCTTEQQQHQQHPEDDDDDDNTTTTTDDDYFLGVPSSSPETTQPKPKVNTTEKEEEIDMEALTLRITSGRSHNRSVSFDRRMIESAQFAEAVGEDPSDLLLQKIIEQDSSSDFDDDDIDEGGVDMLGGSGLGGGGEEGEEEIILLEELRECTNDKASCASIEMVGSSSDDVGEVDVVAAASSTLSSASSAPPSSSAAEEGPNNSSSNNNNNNNNNNNVEPKCVSTDLSRVSPKESEEVVVCNNNRLDNDDSQQLLLPTNSNNNNNNNNSAPPTPIPSPAKARISPFTSFHPPYVDWKFQRQHSSSASLDGNRFHPTLPTTTTTTTVAAQTNTNNEAADFRGIRLPEITKRGVARGNYAQLHRKAWLEVSDKHHRYGKNLRMYYKHWESLGHPYHMFFDWLDAKGEAQGTELPNLPELPRSVLDSDTVQYIADPGISASYALDIVADPTDGSAFVIDRRSQTPICTGKEGWIFVLRDHVFYGSQKVIAPNKVVETSSSSANSNTNVDENNNATTTTKPRQRFHHSSFFGGKAVASAGIFLTDDQGHLTHLYPHSGHYRPGEAHVQRVLFFMQQLGVELSTFVVDMQQLFKVSRKFAPKGGNNGNDTAVVDNKENTGVLGKQQTTVPQQTKKAKKTDCLHLMCGLETACFLAHKALMIERGVFHQIHKIRRIAPDARSVRNILNHVN